MRHIFLLSEIRKENKFAVDFETVALVDVDPEKVTCAELRPWALRTLSAQHCLLGLYVGEFGTVRDSDSEGDEDECPELDTSFADEWIAWDGVCEFSVP